MNSDSANRVAFLPSQLRPRHISDIVRIGPLNDGGYYIAERSLAATSHLLSLGLSDDWRFEADFLSRTGVGVTAYDHTVDRGYFARRRIRRLGQGMSPSRKLPPARSTYSYRDYRVFFSSVDRNHIRAKIGHPEQSVSLGSAIDSISGLEMIYLKCDIEGWEWRSIHELASRSPRLTGLVIEFHDVDLHLQRLMNFVEQMHDFAVIDLQVNNYTGLSPSGIPEVVEISMAPAQLVEPDDRPYNSDRLVAHNPLAPAIQVVYH